LEKYGIDQEVQIANEVHSKNEPIETLGNAKKDTLKGTNASKAKRKW